MHMDSISDVLDRLAADIAKDLQAEGVSLQQKLEAFKILSAREAAGMKKSPGRPSRNDPEPDDDDDDGVPDFRSMASRIHAVG